MTNKLLTLVIFIFLFSSCATSPVRYGSDLETAKARYKEGKKPTAYILLENYLNDGDDNERQAKEFIMSHPDLIESGLSTFQATDMTMNNMFKHKIWETLELAKNSKIRLLLFKTVAPKSMYLKARSEYEKAFPKYFDRIDELEKNKKLLEIKVSRQKELTVLNKLTAVKNAKFECLNILECKKAFAHTQIFINKYATRKIQLVTEAIIETYNATDAGIAMKAIKTPKDGDNEEIAITVVCEPVDNDKCENATFNIYKAYPIYMKSVLK